MEAKVKDLEAIIKARDETISQQISMLYEANEKLKALEQKERDVKPIFAVAGPSAGSAVHRQIKREVSPSTSHIQPKQQNISTEKFPTESS